MLHTPCERGILRILSLIHFKLWDCVKTASVDFQACALSKLATILHFYMNTLFNVIHPL